MQLPLIFHPVVKQASTGSSMCKSDAKLSIIK